MNRGLNQAVIRKKAQTSLEFLAMFGFTMLIFTGFYLTFINEEFKVVERETNLFADSVAERIGFELDLAWLQEKGFSRNFTLPDAIAGADYTINITNKRVFVEWEDTFVSTRIVANTTGTLTPGENKVTNNGTHVIIN